MKYELIPINSIKFSDTNPRKLVNTDEIAELAQSIKRVGIINPVTVRHLSQGYELVAGYKRCRAAADAGLTEIPAVIQTLTDEEVLEIQIIENLQRSDIHPLDEAEAFAVLLKNNNTVEDISAKIGSSIGYIYKRLQLNELIPDAKEKFYQNKFNTGIAMLIARMTAEQQEKLIEKQLPRWTDSSGVVTASSMAVKQYIRQNFMLNLNEAPFSKTSASLYSEAGACSICPKRTGYNQTLFDDIIEDDTCTDPVCFNRKKQLHITQVFQKARKKYPGIIDISTKYGGGSGMPGRNDYNVVAPGDECEFMRKGIIAESWGDEDAGKVVDICMVKTCPKHWLDDPLAETRGDEEHVKNSPLTSKWLTEYQFNALAGAILNHALSSEFNRAMLTQIYQMLMENLSYFSLEKAIKHFDFEENQDEIIQDTLKRLADFSFNDNPLRYIYALCVYEMDGDDLAETAKSFNIDPEPFYELAGPEEEE